MQSEPKNKIEETLGYLTTNCRLFMDFTPFVENDTELEGLFGDTSLEDFIRAICAETGGKQFKMRFNEGPKPSGRFVVGMVVLDQGERNHTHQAYLFFKNGEVVGYQYPDASH